MSDGTVNKKELIDWLKEYKDQLINSTHLGPYSAANILDVVARKVEAS